MIDRAVHGTAEQGRDEAVVCGGCDVVMLLADEIAILETVTSSKLRPCDI